MAFYFGTGSKKRLEGLHPELVQVLNRAIEISTVDFRIHEGVRDLATQRHYLAIGASKTLNSLHLPQPDGFGHAADLYPLTFKDPFPRASEDPTMRKRKLDAFREVARAMYAAADELGILIQWGNDWNADGIETGADPDERGQIPDFPHWQLARPNRRHQASALAAKRKAAT